MAVKNISSTKPAAAFERWKLALSLPILNAEILPDHAKTCPFCEVLYNPKFEVVGEYRGHETATMFPCCKSIIGFHCARDWLLPHDGSFGFCPFCEKSYETSTGAFEWHVSTTEELLESGMATLVLQSTIDTDAPGDNAGLLPNIDQALSASSSDSDSQDTIRQHGSPTILVTDLEGGISPGSEASIMKHISNADTARSFIQANAGNLVVKVKKPVRSKLKVGPLLWLRPKLHRVVMNDRRLGRHKNG